MAPTVQPGRVCLSRRRGWLIEKHQACLVAPQQQPRQHESLPLAARETRLGHLQRGEVGFTQGRVFTHTYIYTYIAPQQQPRQNEALPLAAREARFKHVK